jgi:hypothetical protein
MHVWVSNHKEIIMATVNKDFKVKHGLIVEGANATVDGSDIITEDALVGGTQTNITVTYDAENKVVNFVAESGLEDGDTDDLSEGSNNLYFTDARAKTSAADLLTGATLENISITGDGNGLTITAENGVADSTTDDLTEGSINLYHTEQRAMDAAATLLTSATLENIAISGDGNGLTITAENGVSDSTTDDLNEGTENLYFTDTRARNAVSAGDGLGYNSTSGEFSADLGNGLQFDGTGQIEIDNNVVATQTDLSDDIGAHSDLTTGVHGVTGNVVGTDDVQTLENKVLGSGTTLGASIDAEGFTISNLSVPDQASDAATKAYVDSVAEGLHVHESAVAATTANVDLTTGGLLEVDGVQLVADDRVLVKSQTTLSENGIYLAKAGAWVRAEDYNSSAEIQGGDFTFVTGGSLYADTGWVQLNAVTTLGSDPIEFSQFSGAGTFTAGNGLTLNGTEFAIDTTVTATKTHVDDKIEDHSDLTTGVHGVTGNVVGTSDTQTLTDKTLGSGTILGADLDGTNTHKIVNLVDPSSAQDAATKNYVDENFVSVDDLPGQLDDYIPLTQKGEENGVATLDETGQVPLSQLGNVTEAIDGLTTTDVTEGTNLYFTDARAVDALEAVVPNFTAVEVNSVAKQVAATVSAPTAESAVVAYAFAKASYRSAKFLVKVAYSTHTEVSEVLLTLDTSDNIAITEFAVVSTNGSASVISAGINETDVELLVTPTNNTSTVTVVGTLLA